MSRGQHKNNNNQESMTTLQPSHPTLAIPADSNTIEIQANGPKCNLINVLNPLKKKIHSALREIQ